MLQASITVFGAGYVGLVTGACLANSGHSVTLIDTDSSRIGALKLAISPIHEPGIETLLRDGIASSRLRFALGVEGLDLGEFIYVAVGTPMTHGGAADLRHVREVLDTILVAGHPGCTVVMKSTVPPGTGERLAARLADRGITYVSNPEFLREGTAINDWRNADRIVLGGSPDAVNEVARLYSDLASPVVRTSIATAELVKYASNAFLATKISFINEIAAVCDLVGADVIEVANAVGLDQSIGGAFLSAGIGYGGSCFPKDTQALGFLSSFNGYDFNLLKAVIEVNSRQRMLPVKALRDRLGDLAGKSVAVLGMAFKPDTDDIRESPGIDITCLLLAEGAVVNGYDPMAAASIDDARFNQCATIEEAVSGAAAAVIATEWPAIVTADWGRLVTLMCDPRVVFDGRNALNSDPIQASGGCYLAVGRPMACSILRAEAPAPPR
jgi:UDPglucose 6-dehydrogenase